MSSTLTISGKVLGRTKPLFQNWSISLSSPSLTLKDLILHIVLEEIEAFRIRQQERRLVKVLSPEEIRQGVQRGKIDMGGQEIISAVDVEAAIENAWQSFADGFYFVFIDDKQIETLDSLVNLNDNSEVIFLRLIPLVGG
jgi:hypothetical protein